MAEIDKMAYFSGMVKGILRAFAVCGVLILYQSCQMPEDPNPPGDNMSGVIALIDTNLISGGFYAVSLFSADSSNPFRCIPLRSDSLVLNMRENRVYEGLYDMSGIGTGKYYVASSWVSYPRIPNSVPIVLAVYGCDTARDCTNYIAVFYPNYEGVYRNIVSPTDTARRIN